MSVVRRVYGPDALDGVIEGSEDPKHPFSACVSWQPERCRTNELSRSPFAELPAAASTVAKAGAGSSHPEAG